MSTLFAQRWPAFEMGALASLCDVAAGPTPGIAFKHRSNLISFLLCFLAP
jgi:hypothetical protein